MNPFSSKPAASVASLGEQKLLTAIRRWLGRSAPLAPAGMGDDCAVLPAPRGLVAKTFLGAMLGLLLGITFSWGRDAWHRLTGVSANAALSRDPSDDGQGEPSAVLYEDA